MTDRTDTAARAFVWLTPLDDRGRPGPRTAFAVGHIISVADGAQASWEDWEHADPGDAVRHEPTVRTYTPGAVLVVAGIGDYGSSARVTVQEPSGEVVLFCEGFGIAAQLVTLVEP